jgi:hypothetical protein
MSFNPPTSPVNGDEFTYGNVTWRYQNPPGVWNIKDGSLIGTDGVGVSGFRIDGSNLKFYYVYPDGATSSEINLGTVVGAGGAGGGLTFRASNNTTDSVEPGETFTITGAGPTVRTTVSGNTMTVDVRVATKGETGLARFSDDFNVVGGLVSLDKAGGTGPTLRDSQGTQDITRLSSTITLTGGSGIFTVRSAEDTISFRGHTATSSTLGVASFNTRDFSVASGAVSFATNAASIVYRDSSGETGEFTAAPVRSTFTITGGQNTGIFTRLSSDKQTLSVAGTTASYTERGTVSFDPRFFGIGSTGHVTLTGPYQVTGDTVTQGFGITVTRTASNTVEIASNGVAASDFRIAGYSVTGVASFDPRFFGIGLSGHLTLTGSYQVTGDTVAGDSGAIAASRTNNDVRLTSRLATNTGATGVASFNPTHFTVSSGAVSVTSGPFLTVRDEANQTVGLTFGNTFTLTGGTGIDVRLSSGTNTFAVFGVTATAPVAGGGRLGLSYFNGTQFTIGADGGVSVNTASNSSPGIASFNASNFTVAGGAVSLSGAYGRIGVTGIGFGNDVGLTGKINITAGTNMTITRSGNTITLASGGGQGSGLPTGLTAQKDRLVFTNHVENQGLTHSANLLFDGTSLSFGGEGTRISITGPTASFSPRTAVLGGVYADFKERGFAWTINLTAAANPQVEIGPTGGYFQKIDLINLTGGYWSSNPNALIEFRPTSSGWSDVPNTVESVLVIARQRTSGRLAAFPYFTDLGTFITHNDPVMMGVTGGVDIFMITRYKTDTSEIFFGQSLARGMTGYTFTY